MELNAHLRVAGSSIAKPAPAVEAVADQACATTSTANEIMADITIDQLAQSDLRSGNLEVRLAETAAEVDAAQALRYQVFYNEMAAKPTREMEAAHRDFDKFDQLCDHLLVIDHNRGSGAEGVIGTYRLIRRKAADRVGRFYSSDEYNIAPLAGHPGEVLELGRSCVDAV